MAAAPWMFALGLALVGAGGPTGRWLGQDGHDFTSASPELKPNGFQDIHIVLEGLPASGTIRRIVVRPYGSGEYQYNGPPGSWPVALQRAEGSRTADLFVETGHVETGRAFELAITYDDGSEAHVTVAGGKADPNRRMPAALPRAAWLGQPGADRTGLGPAVGPDGRVDARIALTNLPAKAEIQGVGLEGPGGVRWQAGPNSAGDHNAELVRDPREASKADLYFQPDRDLGGGKLRLFLLYADGKGDVLTVPAGRTDPNRGVPRASLPTFVADRITARWLGQEERPPGDVRIELAGLPPARRIAATVLSDSIQGTWAYRTGEAVKTDPPARPMALDQGDDRSRAVLTFAPYRDEQGTTLTLRIAFEDGAMAFAQLEGGPCDLARRIPAVAPTAVVAKPGDDLHDLTKRYGNVRLSAGTYRLSRPLVLEKPIALEGERGSTLKFAQGGDQPPWGAAIKIHSGGTTLRGFTVRFEGPVRWDPATMFGPALIGTTDNLDPPHPDPKTGLTLDGLDLEAPAASGRVAWEDSPRVIRLINASQGLISNCRLYGGPIEFFGGPWEVVDNVSRGTVPGTVNPCVVGGHNVHDLVVRGNRVRPADPRGKTWRFLVLTGRGERVRVEGNEVVGVGPRDDDTIPSQNAPEVFLTESYRLGFEGRLAAISRDRRVIRVALTQGPAPSAGDVVAVLAGPGAGQWRKIAEPIDPTTYLLEAPLPEGSDLVSICAGGFLDTRFEENLVDSRGGRVADNLVLAGNHFGTVVRKNRLLGGREAIRIMATASETPLAWGWSHAPYLGGVVEGNLIEDSLEGGVLRVEHDRQIKSNAGRTYLTLALRDNTVRWTEAFLRASGRGGAATAPRAFTLGDAGGIDPGEMVVTERGDRLEVPTSDGARPCVRVRAAVLNGVRTVGREFVLPKAPAVPEVSRAQPR